MKSKLIDVMIIGILVWSVISIPSHVENIEQVWKAADRPVVVLDPGHGGIDGGAEGIDGTTEKDINLNIALDLKKRLTDEGFRVVMTRITDQGLYEDNDKAAIRSLKTEDMHERKRIIDEVKPDLTVSIHLNSFTQDTSVKGAQVFYPTEGKTAVIEKSRQAAEIIQAGFNEEINADKDRIELGKNDVFIFKNTYSPIVIAECGFLSNAYDLEKLKTTEHQENISKSLKASICKYFASFE